MRAKPPLLALLALFLALVSSPVALQAQRAPQRPLYPAGVDSARLAGLVDSNLALGRRSFDHLLGLKGRSAGQGTLRVWDEARRFANEADGLAQLALNLHPDSTVRAEGVAAIERVSRFRNELVTSPQAAQVFQSVDTVKLSPVERLYLTRILRNFRRAGVLLPDAARDTLRQHLETMDRLATSFARNIAEDTTRVFAHERELEGLPADWIERHHRDAQGRLILTMSYPDFFPVLKYATNRATRYRMTEAFENRGRLHNRIVLDSLLRVREAVAHRLGYSNWAAYQVEVRMAGSADSVQHFIDRVHQAATPASRRIKARQLALLRQEDSAVTELAMWDDFRAAELQGRVDFNVDSRVVRDYFPFQIVRAGVLAVTAELFGVTFRKAKLPVWHSSVEGFEVVEQGQPIGRFYLDLHPRPGKYQHAAVFPVRQAVTGRWLPEGVLVANLPGGQAGDPGLMEMDDVVTFFHEFGHLIHHMFARQPYAELQWPEEGDFIEAPSMMLEELVQQPQVLRRLSRHVKTGQSIPDTLLRRLRAADVPSRPRFATFQAALAAVSIALHRTPAAQVNIDSLTYRKLADYSGLHVPDTTHFATSFDHLGANDYSASYYTYLWSQVIAKDLWSAFDPARPLSSGPAGRYRDMILRPGGGKPARQLVEDFLGRPFQFESWRRWLEGKERAGASKAASGT